MPVIVYTKSYLIISKSYDKKLSMRRLYPPKRLVLLHFLSTFFSVLEWAVLWLWLDTIFKNGKIEYWRDGFCPKGATTFSKLYCFAFRKCLYYRQKVFSIFSCHNYLQFSWSSVSINIMLGTSAVFFFHIEEECQT